MSSIETYLSRMTVSNVWPAAHSPQEAADAFQAVHWDGQAILRWNSNDQCPMNDMLAAWITLGMIDREQADRTSAARTAETAQFLAAYRKNPPQIDDEQLHEMRAAFGPGEEVMDVITGRTIQL